MTPLEVIDMAIAEHKPSHVFALFSGGHDSLCSTHVAAQHPRFSGAVHINTGIGIEETREFVRETCRREGWPLIELRTPPDEYRSQVMKAGFPAGEQQHQVMYRRLKERRVEDLMRDYKRGPADRIVLLSGARSQESRVRMGSTQIMRRSRSQVWVNPILDWSGEDKYAYMEKHSLVRNPVVDHLHMSGECLCGCYANEPESGELSAIRFFFPNTATYIEAIEQKAFEAGVWCRWGQFRPEVKKPGLPAYAERGKAQPWLPLCQSCPTRWERPA